MNFERLELVVEPWIQISCGLVVTDASRLYNFTLPSSPRQEIVWVIILDNASSKGDIQEFLSKVGQSMETIKVILVQESRFNNDNYLIHYGCSLSTPKFQANHWSIKGGFLKPDLGFKKLCLGQNNWLDGQSLKVQVYGDAPFQFPNEFRGINFEILK